MFTQDSSSADGGASGGHSTGRLFFRRSDVFLERGDDPSRDLAADRLG